MLAASNTLAIHPARLQTPAKAAGSLLVRTSGEHSVIWTEEQDQTLIALRSDGYSAAEIGAKIGFSRNAVLGRVYRLNLPPLDPNYRRTERKAIVSTSPNVRPWSVDEDDLLAQLRADGISNYAIAAKLGRAIRTVAKRVTELKLHRKKQAIQDRHYMLGPPRSKTPTPPKFFVSQVAPGSSPVPLIYRTGCCYPVTDEKPHKFCNEPADGSYCEFHRSIMYHKRAA